jgi:hypothetical protein
MIIAFIHRPPNKKYQIEYLVFVDHLTDARGESPVAFISPTLNKNKNEASQ